jgi:hypothetical protein
VTGPVVDVDILVREFEWETQDFSCELLHITEEFSVMSDIDINVSAECPGDMEVEATVSKEAVLEQEVQPDNIDSESDVFVVECEQMLYTSVDERSMSVEVRN